MKPFETDSCCTPQDTAADAARVMNGSGCGCAPVIEDANDRTLVGVVTEHDVCHHVAAHDHRPSHVPVEEIMQSPSACCQPDQSIEEVRHQLDEHQATSLPVMDTGGSCCGIVSAQDLDRTGAPDAASSP